MTRPYLQALEIVALPRRREILRLIWRRERAAGEIAASFSVTFGAISQHLKKLADAGLVSVRRDGRQRFYRARREAFGPLAVALEAMWNDRLGRLKDVAEREEGRRG